MRWIGQLAVAVNKTTNKGEKRQVPAAGTTSPGARRRHRSDRRGR